MQRFSFLPELTSCRLLFPSLPLLLGLFQGLLFIWHHRWRYVLRSCAYSLYLVFFSLSSMTLSSPRRERQSSLSLSLLFASCVAVTGNSPWLLCVFLRCCAPHQLANGRFVAPPRALHFASPSGKFRLQKPRCTFGRCCSPLLPLSVASSGESGGCSSPVADQKNPTRSPNFQHTFLVSVAFRSTELP